MVINDNKWLQIIILHHFLCFLEKSKKYFWKFSKISDFSGQWGHFGGSERFMPKSAQSQIFTRVRVAQQLHFKPIKSVEASWSDLFTVKKLLQIRQTAPPSVQNKISNIFYWSSGRILPFHNCFWEVPVKSWFFGISTPKYVLPYITNLWFCWFVSWFSFLTFFIKTPSIWIFVNSHADLFWLLIWT